MIDHKLRNELLDLISQDDRMREELAKEGSLFEGYHPRMEAVHKQNFLHLREIIERHGWPGIDLAGPDGEEAAWRIAQHSISEPHFQRAVLQMLKKSAADGQAPLWQVAYLEDRIRMFEGKLQLYGTSFDWDENGRMSPYPEIENRDQVNQRRAEMGLPPLEKEIERHRAAVTESPPQDLQKRRAEMDAWARATGWR